MSFGIEFGITEKLVLQSSFSRKDRKGGAEIAKKRQAETEVEAMQRPDGKINTAYYRTTDPEDYPITPKLGWIPFFSQVLQRKLIVIDL